MRMKLHAELIFIWKVSHLDSFWNRGTRELGNGLLRKRSSFDDCTKDVLKELHVQEEEMSDSDEESAEVDDN